ncbi:F-box/kelch-repeat protein [Senna tora]|uniref:F-box/kelch-repeat protein n=1 Tax=Senna tora TaxID=362788 RepID=A0A834SLM1_9FABA|nr:F-box/kelch-repeat protein [Senna tora]
MASKRMVEDLSAEILCQLPYSAKNPRLLVFHDKYFTPLKPRISLFSCELPKTPAELGFPDLPDPKTLQVPLELGLPFAESSQPPIDNCLPFRNTSQPSINLELPFPDKHVFQLVPWGLCKGVFCLYVTYLDSPDDLILWNPATREFKVLPLPNHLRPIMKSCKHGFGVDPQKDDFKVVCIWMENELPDHLRETNLPLVEVYSLKSNSWKKIRVTLPASNLRNSILNSSYLNGIYHWLSNEGIVCFDMSNEVFSKMKLPRVFVDQREFIFYGDLVVYNDCIAYVLEYGIWKELGRWIGSFRTDVWVMNKHGVEESWDKCFSIGPEMGHFQGFWKTGEILAAHDFYERLVCFNLDTQQPVMQFPVARGGPLRIAIFKYVESVVPLSGFVAEKP